MSDSSDESGTILDLVEDYILKNYQNVNKDQIETIWFNAVWGTGPLSGRTPAGTQEEAYILGGKALIDKGYLTKDEYLELIMKVEDQHIKLHDKINIIR